MQSMAMHSSDVCSSGGVSSVCTIQREKCKEASGLPAAVDDTTTMRCLLLAHNQGLAAHPHTARRTVAVTVGCATGRAACVPYPPNPNSGVVQQDYQGLAQTGPACATRRPDTQRHSTQPQVGANNYADTVQNTRPRYYAPTPQVTHANKAPLTCCTMATTQTPLPGTLHTHHTRPAGDQKIPGALS